MITGLNHLTLTVGHLQQSLDFYRLTLGFKLRAKWKTGAYLELGELWLCLSLGNSQPAQDYTHYAFTIDEASFASFTSKLEAAHVVKWQSNLSEGDSYYFLDPDGHQLEVHVGNLYTRLANMKPELFENLVVFESREIPIK